MCTCRQMAKFASEKRRFGDVTLHAKFKHVATQFAHRGITHGEGRLLQHTDVFKVLRTCRQMAKFANEKRRFGGCYLAHKIETRCNTICTPWHYSRGTDGTKGLFQTQVSNAKTPCIVRNFLPIGQIFSFGRQFRWETYQQTAFRNIAIATACDLKVN